MDPVFKILESYVTNGGIINALLIIILHAKTCVKLADHDARIKNIEHS
jgi:hypothetical protein